MPTKKKGRKGGWKRRKIEKEGRREEKREISLTGLTMLPLKVKEYLTKPSAPDRRNCHLSCC